MFAECSTQLIEPIVVTVCTLSLEFLKGFTNLKVENSDCCTRWHVPVLMTFQITQSLRNSLVISFWEVLLLVALEIVLVTKNKFWWIHP